MFLIFPSLNHNSLQHIPIVEIHDHHEAIASEVLPAAEEHLEQDVLQTQYVNTPVGSTKDDDTEDKVTV